MDEKKTLRKKRRDEARAGKYGLLSKRASEGVSGGRRESEPERDNLTTCVGNRRQSTLKEQLAGWDLGLGAGVGV
ncbi:uncharacterized protein SPSK_10945 [Sporothrix schenckii 1099-18]|uniref:Uncharacterized protein n=1 Tax=Sporothrix schenckii 1099-18 TaxID=1397361 RepID=A0A0F2M996_SPOSC|nr:uncharacterized protein SPSK_10945 [Sporothrix schenckii 1099-18]KJR85654.1 hypothetical protein SPSK_10945 [Sporothrix schenckii 1099-18]